MSFLGDLRRRREHSLHPQTAEDLPNGGALDNPVLNPAVVPQQATGATDVPQQPTGPTDVQGLLRDLQTSREKLIKSQLEAQIALQQSLLEQVCTPLGAPIPRPDVRYPDRVAPSFE